MESGKLARYSARMAVSASQGSDTTKAARTATTIISGSRQLGAIFMFLNEKVGTVETNNAPTAISTKDTV